MDEGESFVFEVTLDASANSNVVFDYVITGDVATDDFVSGSLTGQFTLLEGTTNAVFSIETLRDNILEGNEPFQVEISTQNTNLIHTTPTTFNGSVEDSEFIFFNGFD
jgi:hypothetical protein